MYNNNMIKHWKLE